MLPLLLVVLLVACGSGEPPGYDVSAGLQADVQRDLPPVDMSRDEAPHDVLTEWWYYTGHLYGEGRRYGFEMVVFQAVRGELPRSYVAHFAVTDIADRTFRHDERSFTGPQPQPERGFRFEFGGWSMGGLNGRDRLRAGMEGYAIDLSLRATKPVVLHEGDGLIDFGPAGASYYYSRTRMDVRGTLTDGGERVPVTGQAWMDHQWGDFISVAGGGWDWYSIHLEDGSDLTISVVRNVEGEAVLTYGTYVEPDGSAQHLAADQFSTEATGSWTSPATGVTYPSGWRLSIPGRKLRLTVTPVLRNQELDTEDSTGVVYWEGAVNVTGTRGSRPVHGVGYVELTGYGGEPAQQAGR